MSPDKGMKEYEEAQADLRKSNEEVCSDDIHAAFVLCANSTQMCV
jgi:hypothetical protein